MSLRFGHFEKDCLYTVVQNISGYTRFFGYLPPHGRTLTVGQTFSVFGDLANAISANNNRPLAEKLIQSFANDLDSGYISIISTPNPILEDTVTGATQQVALTSGSLVLANACWHTSDSTEKYVAS